MAEVTALKVYTQQEVVDFPLSKDHKNSWERFLKDLGIFLSRDVSACKFRYKDEDNELVGLDTEMEWKEMLIQAPSSKIEFYLSEPALDCWSSQLFSSTIAKLQDKVELEASKIEAAKQEAEKREKAEKLKREREESRKKQFELQRIEQERKQQKKKLTEQGTRADPTVNIYNILNPAFSQPGCTSAVPPSSPAPKPNPPPSVQQQPLIFSTAGPPAPANLINSQLGASTLTPQWQTEINTLRELNFTDPSDKIVLLLEQQLKQGVAKGQCLSNVIQILLA